MCQGLLKKRKKAKKSHSPDTPTAEAAASNVAAASVEPPVRAPIGVIASAAPAAEVGA